MIPVNDDQIGGAVARRRIDRGQLPPITAGQRLTRDEVLAIPTANRRALVATERLWLLPIDAAAPAGRSADRHIVQVGRGQYDVFAGVKLNSEPLTKDDAEELATRPD